MPLYKQDSTSDLLKNRTPTKSMRKTGPHVKIREKSKKQQHLSNHTTKFSYIASTDCFTHLDSSPGFEMNGHLLQNTGNFHAIIGPVFRVQALLSWKSFFYLFLDLQSCSSQNQNIRVLQLFSFNFFFTPMKCSEIARSFLYRMAAFEVQALVESVKVCLRV